MVGSGAHPGRVCHLHKGLCVHASSLFPVFAMDMDSVGPSLPITKETAGAGLEECRWCFKLSSCSRGVKMAEE